MSSSLERRASLRLGVKLSLAFMLLFGVVGLAFGYGMSRLVWEAMEEEWDQELRACFESSERPDEDMRPTVQRIRASAEKHFQDKLPLLLIPSLVVGLAGGLGLTYLLTRNQRNVLRAVQRIRRTGSYDERLPLTNQRGAMREMVVLFNEMFELTEKQLNRFRESLDSVAHDLRTPLARLRGSAESVLKKGKTVDDYRSTMSDCLEESEQLVGMLNALMAIAEAEAGALEIQSVPVPVSELIQSVADLYAFVGEDRDIRVEVDLEPDLVVAGHPELLRQALANLVDNAVKFSPDGGRVEIAARREGDEVIFLICDEGPGVPPDEAERIWERLYRGDKSRQTPGLGLGLSFVRAIVHAHRGSVEAENRPDGGAVFTVHLPTGERVS